KSRLAATRKSASASPQVLRGRLYARIGRNSKQKSSQADRLRGMPLRDANPPRLRPPAPRHLEEKRFHATQTLHPQPDGRTIAEFELTALEEMTSFVLSFGPLAEVLEPAELRERVRGFLRKALNIYEGTGVVSDCESQSAVSTAAKNRR